MAQKRKSKKQSSNFKKQMGLRPGTAIYTGHKQEKNLKIDYHIFDANTINQGTLHKTEDVITLKNNNLKLWANLNGLNHTKVLKIFAINSIFTH